MLGVLGILIPNLRCLQDSQNIAKQKTIVAALSSTANHTGFKKECNPAQLCSTTWLNTAAQRTGLPE